MEKHCHLALRQIVIIHLKEITHYIHHRDAHQSTSFFHKQSAFELIPIPNGERDVKKEKRQAAAIIMQLKSCPYMGTDRCKKKKVNVSIAP